MNHSAQRQHGAYDWRQMMATAHRPTDPTALASEAHRLTGDGLTARDISTILGISEGAVSTLLRDSAAQPNP